MANKKNATGNSGLSANLLPKFYQTPANKKFLQSTIDQLFQPGSVRKVSGYVGRQNAKAASRSDLFIEASDTTRQRYQLEPGLSIQDEFGNTTFYKDYIDYVNQVKIFGGNVDNHARLNTQEFYSWDPHIDWDKFINFQNYYWMPIGPEVVAVSGQGINIQSTYTVDLTLAGNSNVYVFTPNGSSINPVLRLYRGHTYTFEINSPGNPFSLKTDRSPGSLNRYEVGGLDHAVEQGTITVTIPEDAPTTLFYQSESDISVGGVIEVYDVTEATYLDIENDVLGKKYYTLGNGTALSNGMLVEFIGKVKPASYETGSYYVEGVGTAIKLVPASSLEIVSSYTEVESIQFDNVPFDTSPFDGSTGYATVVDYVTINKASPDRNPWSRYNRWVHKDVIAASAEYNGNIPALDQNARAIRPIIEFQAGLKLFNMGTNAIVDVDLVDDFTLDVFSIIEGSTGYNIDGVDLVSGYKILVVADTDPLVNNKIYTVERITIDGIDRIHLSETLTPSANDVTIVRNGKKNQSKPYWFNGATWVVGQQKTNTNQSPLFDVVDDDGVSYGDNTVYNGTSFTGTSIFSYKVGTGTADTALGFSLAYKNVSNIGDIVFNFTLSTDTFQYKQVDAVESAPINIGYLVKQNYNGTSSYVNGWQKSTATTVQAAVRIYNDDKVNNFDLDIFDNIDDLRDLTVRVYVNGVRLDHNKWSLTTGTVYKRVVLNTDIASSDILTIKAFANQKINGNGFYEIPINLQNNPLNAEIGSFTLGEVLDHVNSIVDNATGFEGAFPGSGNLRDLGNITPLGTKFVQHSGPLSLAMYHITSQDNNIITAIDRSRDDYSNFKRYFVTVAENLGVDADPQVMLELVMQKVNANKPKTSPYYFSDMVPYGAKIDTNLTVVDNRLTLYPLSTVFTLTELSNKAVCVYLNGTQLVHGRDYTFDTQGLINVTATLAVGDIITTSEFENTDGSFVPATPTKLGLWPKYEPMIYLDTSLVTPRWMIQGHDGSQVLAYGTYGEDGDADYRDALILELEKRIYNNIKVEYNPSIFDIADIIPGYNRSVSYTRDEFNQVLAPSFYKWTGLVGIDFTKPITYDRSNPFTFNYSLNYSPDGAQVPAYWRGIYRWMLDTDRPHLCPWETLGFSVKPLWWDSVYGPAPYTKDNLVLWSDLAAGIVREPGVPVVKRDKFVRPYLASHIPVDDQGNLVSPLTCGMVSGVVTQSVNNNFVFGDVSPVETAWRRSSHYAFSVLSASMLLTPARTFGLALDRSRVVRNMAGQLVYADTKLRVTPSDIVLPSIPSSTERVQTAGIINYVVDYIMNYIFSNNVLNYESYASDLQLIVPKLGYRVGAFTNKEQFKLLLESKSPVSAGSVFVPQEDYSLFLNQSSAVKKLTYSGIIITKLSTGFEVKGYSRTAPYFKYYGYVRSGSVINVGGISASYSVWTVGARYNVGTIVSFNNEYYSTKVAHTASQFDPSVYMKLAALPITGGVNVTLRTAWDRKTELVAPYGTTFATVQEVVDFISGYSEWLKDQGFVFDEFDPTSNTVSNWNTSAKEFMFWSTQNWSSGADKWQEWTPGQALPYSSIVRYNGDYYSAAFNIPADLNEIFDEDQFTRLDGLSNVGSSVISLSPAAFGLTFNTELTVVDDIGNPYNDYEIFKVDGTPIPISELNSYREGNRVTYSPVGTDGIFGASFYLVQNEHLITINNTTIFNDTIYAPASGYRQERIKVSGYVTENWYGGLDIPGFVYDQANIRSWQPWQDYTAGDVVLHQGFYYSANAFVAGTATFDPAQWNRSSEKPTQRVIPNWTNLATQFTDFYSLESNSFNAGHQSVAQHLIGYQKRQYLENIIQDDVSEFKFYQGMIREKGTQNVLNKLFDPLNQSGQESLTFYEEWALRVGQYGATNTFETIEFVLDEGKFKNNPQGLITSTNDINGLGTFIIGQPSNSIYLKPAGFDGSPFPAATDLTPYLRTPGYVNPSDVKVNIGSIDDIVDQDITEFSDGSVIWCSFAQPPRVWDLFRLTARSDITVSMVQQDGNTMIIIVDGETDISTGDYIGITRKDGDVSSQTDKIAGFYKVDDLTYDSDPEIDATTIILTATISGFPAEFTELSSVVINTLTVQRVNTIDELDNVVAKNAGELLWIDNSGNDQWGVWEYNKCYGSVELDNTSNTTLFPYNTYGTVLAMSANGAMSAVNTLGGSFRDETLPQEVVTREKIGLSVPWTAKQEIQVPFISNLELGHDFNNDNDNKQVSAIAMSPDATWMAIGYKNVGHVATKTTTDLFKPVLESGTNTSFVNQGIVSLYKKDVNNVYSIVFTVASPFADDDEYFGASLALSDNRLFVGATGSRSVYAYKYDTTVSVTKVYEPYGSSGTTIVLSSVTDIVEGMFVVGTGFDGQYVVSINSESNSVSLSSAPTSTPSNTISFVTVDWDYEGTVPNLSNIAGFGGSITVSSDQTKLIVLTSSGIKLHSIASTFPLLQTVAGTNAALSAASEYLAVTTGSAVNIYKWNGTSYVMYQSGLAQHLLNIGGNFGNKLAFMNGYETLVVYSKDTEDGVLAVYDRYNTQWVYSETIGSVSLTSTDYGFAVSDNQILVSDDAGSNLFNYYKKPGIKTWTQRYAQEAIPDVYKIKQAFLYNKATGKLVKYLDVVDPIQGKIPGIADQEIKFKTFYDPASYSVGTDAVTVNSDSFWSTEQVGALWWDLRPAKFVSPYFSDVVYKTNIWNTLAAGASIDIYEWVESTVIPSEWDSLAGTPEGDADGISGTSLYGDDVYSVRQRYDNISKRFTNTYYFWVKNRNVVPVVSGRNISALEVANLITNPRGQSYQYLAITALNSFSLVNVKKDLEDTNVVLSIEYWVTDSVDKNSHTQWKIVSNDSIVNIPQHVEEKWFDSLCGMDSAGRAVPDEKQPLKLRYGIENRPRQSMFVNRIEALKEFIERTNRVLIKNQVVQTADISELEKYDLPPSANSGLYDLEYDTELELRLANVGTFTMPVVTPIISNSGAITGIEIISAGKGYINPPNIIVHGDGVGAELRATIGKGGVVTGVTVINGGEGYAPDTTTLSVRGYAALVKMDSEASGNWCVYTYEPSTSIWSRSLTQTYDVRKYWSKVDWYATGYNQFSSPDFAVNTFAELNTISPNVGETVKVLVASNSGWLLLERYSTTGSVDWTQSYSVVGVQNGTIQFSNTLYDFVGTSFGYDAAVYDGAVYDLFASDELRIILNVIKNNILVGELKSEYLDLFLASVRYAHSEQLYLDWAFKTSFVKATHNVGTLGQPVTYPVVNLSNFEDYISEVKPYRTHIREYVSSYTGTDTSSITMTDFDLQPFYENGAVSIVNTHVRDNQIVVDDPIIQSHPWKYWLDNVGFTILELRLVDGGSGYESQPTVTIEGGGGINATAKAYIANGKVGRIVLVSSGSGYISAPNIVFTGGLSDGGVAARAIAVIGNGVVRSNLIKMKFDRTSQTYLITDLTDIVTHVGEADRIQFPLTWAPDVNIGKTSVTIDGTQLLRDSYKVMIVKSTTQGYTRYTGSIIFDTAPAEGSDIVITYVKDVSLLSAADRIQFYYSPETGQLGKDLSQLMTGIDYGGVQVYGLGFNISGGWGNSPYGSEAWDIYDREFSDYIVTVGADTHSFTLPYTPEADTELNTYYVEKYEQQHTIIDAEILEYSYDKTVLNTITVSASKDTTTSGVNVTYVSPPGTANKVFVVDSVVGISVGMGIIGGGFNTTHRVVGIDVGTRTITTNVAPTSVPSGTLKFIKNVAGSDILYVQDTTGVSVGDIVRVSMGDAFKYNQTLVTEVIDSTSVRLNQYIKTPIINGSAASFVKTLVDDVDYTTILGSGKITLSESIAVGIVLYINSTFDPIRLDDPNYGTAEQTNSNAIMEPFIADGSTTTFTIPETFVVNDGDTFIIRQSTSDGAIAPQELDYDTTLLGGDLAYSTAKGVDPEEVIVDGDGFVTPTTSPGPEEMVPGQVVDAVAIKVFDRPSNGSASVKVMNYVSDGITSSFEINNTPSSSGAIIVKINQDIVNITTDYTIDYRNNTVEFVTPPEAGVDVSIFSIGFSGYNILDVDYFIGDGTTTEFITRAPYLTETTSLVYVDGVPVVPEKFKTDGTYDFANVVGFRFDTAPAAGALVNFIIVAGSSSTFSVTKTERIATDGSMTYELENPVGNSLLNETSMIVRVDQTILKAPNNQYFTIGSNKYTYTVDPTRVVPSSVSVQDVSVIADGNLLELGVDYIINLDGLSVRLNQSTYRKYTGKQLIIAITKDAGYFYNSDTNSITFMQAYTSENIVEVISSYAHDSLDMQTTTVNVNSVLDVTYGTAEYYEYKAIFGGRIKFDRTVIDDNYIWVVKNDKLLTHSIDYKLLEDKQTIQITDKVAQDDAITLITFGSNVVPEGIAYMQFKDMLNRVQYKRLNVNKQARLVKDLYYFDTSIELDDASNFDRPNLAKGRPGIIEIRGERIEYFAISGNILSKLRRSTMGTGAPMRHKSGAFVTEIGSSETIPYKDETVTVQRVSDGTTTVSLDFVPNSVDEIEVFVGGYATNIQWAPGVDYTEGTIVTIGEYTYKVTAYHQSGSTFKSPVTTLDTVDGERVVLETDIPYTDVYEFFVGNIRLRKNPYSMFNSNIAPYSPEGDLEMPADFSVDGESSSITLTSAMPVGTYITVIRRICSDAWDSQINIQEDNNRVSRFLKSQPGSWYTDARQISTGTESITFDSTIITFDRDDITFDNDDGTYN